MYRYARSYLSDTTWDPNYPWMAITYSAAVLGSGRVGAGYRNGELFVGALASTSGLAVLSDLLDVTTI